MQNEKKNFNLAQKKFSKFGTEVDLQIVLEKEEDLGVAMDVLDLAEQELERFDGIFSRFDGLSEVCKLNSNLGEFKEVSQELREIAKLSIELNNATREFFDPRVIGFLEKAGYDCDFSNINDSKEIQKYKEDEIKGELGNYIVFHEEKIKLKSQMDFAGIAKGWFVDKVSELFLQKGYENFVVDIGGDMYFSGHGPNGESWYIDIEGVEHEKMMLELVGLAVATSGIGKRKWEKDGKRYHHLVNPKNPDKYLFDLKSVTVVAEKTYIADVMAKSMFLMGREQAMEFAKEKNIASVILDYRGNAMVSPEMKKFFTNV